MRDGLQDRSVGQDRSVIEQLLVAPRLIWSVFLGSVLLLAVVGSLIVGQQSDPALDLAAKIAQLQQQAKANPKLLESESDSVIDLAEDPLQKPEESQQQPGARDLPAFPKEQAPLGWYLGLAALVLAYFSPKLWRVLSRQASSKPIDPNKVQIPPALLAAATGSVHSSLAERGGRDFARGQEAAANPHAKFSESDLQTIGLYSRLLPFYLLHLAQNEAVVILGLAASILDGEPGILYGTAIVALLLQLFARNKLEVALKNGLQINLGVR